MSAAVTTSFAVSVAPVSAPVVKKRSRFSGSGGWVAIDVAAETLPSTTVAAPVASIAAQLVGAKAAATPPSASTTTAVSTAPTPVHVPITTTADHGPSREYLRGAEYSGVPVSNSYPPLLPATAAPSMFESVAFHYSDFTAPYDETRGTNTPTSILFVSSSSHSGAGRGVGGGSGGTSSSAAPTPPPPAPLLSQCLRGDSCGKKHPRLPLLLQCARAVVVRAHSLAAEAAHTRSIEAEVAAGAAAAEAAAAAVAAREAAAAARLTEISSLTPQQLVAPHLLRLMGKGAAGEHASARGGVAATSALIPTAASKHSGSTSNLDGGGGDVNTVRTSTGDVSEVRSSCDLRPGAVGPAPSVYLSPMNGGVPSTIQAHSTQVTHSSYAAMVATSLLQRPQAPLQSSSMASGVTTALNSSAGVEDWRDGIPITASTATADSPGAPLVVSAGGGGEGAGGMALGAVSGVGGGGGGGRWRDRVNARRAQR